MVMDLKNVKASTEARAEAAECREIRTNRARDALAKEIEHAIDNAICRGDTSCQFPHSNVQLTHVADDAGLQINYQVNQEAMVLLRAKGYNVGQVGDRWLISWRD